MNEWYDSCDLLCDIVTDYRVKSIQSAKLKYERYYPDHQMGKVFNDLLGFRTLCDSYDDKYGCALRKEYEDGKIKTEKEFREAQSSVLFNCKEI